MQVLILWLILRCLTSLFAGYVSYLRPITAIEQGLPVFPLTPPVSRWLERVYISPWMRWDAEWYQQIVTQGYSSTDGTAQFHPLYPWLAFLFHKTGISSPLSLLLISSIAGIAVFYFFYKLAKLELEPKDAFFSLLIFTIAPPSFILFAPYSESLFLLFAILSFWGARQKMWWLAGLAGGLATLTRQQGVLLLLPIAWELYEAADRKFETVVTRWKEWLCLGLIPLGMFIWMTYRAVFLSDFHPDLTNIQKLIYSTLISPSATQVVPIQKFVWPWQAVIISLRKLIAQPDLDLSVNVFFGIFFLIILLITWTRMRISYRIYCFFITVISFSYYTGPIHPYMGLTRHLFLAFPIFISLADIIKQLWLRMLIIVLSVAGMFFLLGLYILKGWVP